MKPKDKIINALFGSLIITGLALIIVNKLLYMIIVLVLFLGLAIYTEHFNSR